MKSDIDTLLKDSSLDALMVLGPAQHNPAMYYLTGGGHLTSAVLIKKVGQVPLLFHTSMERDEAANTGLPIKNMDDYRFTDLLKESGGDVLQASVKRYRMMLSDAGMRGGRMAVYGKIDAGVSYAVLSALQDSLPDLTIVGELGDSTLLRAMATKDSEEVDRIRRMGEITTEVVGRTAEFLTSQKVDQELLIKSDGDPLTIRDVKNRINMWLAELGAENPEGTIFAMGRDAGVPHSSGNPDDILRLGRTIIFDIFPCEPGGGYHFDFTRTWSLGYATDEAVALYEGVLDVYQQIMSEIRVDTLCRPYQERVCELFEAKGHQTQLSHPGTQQGYVHGLGHGLGLHVHEPPWMGITARESDRLVPGVVVTVEPGLYYPERGLGVRLENTVWVRPDGEIELLADFPLDLVLEMRT